MTRPDILELRKRLKKTSEESKAAQERILEKRKKAKTKIDLGVCKKKVPDFEKCGIKELSDIDIKYNNINWHVVQMWFFEALSRNSEEWKPVNFDPENPRIEQIQTWWGYREITPANKMLKTYGPELTKKAIDWLCDNWKTMLDISSKLYGAPTINFLWVQRNSIMSDVVAGKVIKKKKKKHIVAEYNQDQVKDLPKIGWGDDD